MRCTFPVTDTTNGLRSILTQGGGAIAGRQSEGPIGRRAAAIAAAGAASPIGVEVVAPVTRPFSASSDERTLSKYTRVSADKGASAT